MEQSNLSKLEHENINIKDDLVNIVRLALKDKTSVDDVYVFACRLVRKYRKIDADFADQINQLTYEKWLSNGSSITRQ